MEGAWEPGLTWDEGGDWMGSECPSLGMFERSWRSPSGSVVGCFEWVGIGSRWSLPSSTILGFWDPTL